MKKLLLIAPIALASQLAYGAQLYLGNASGTSGGNLNGTIPSPGLGKFYKCTNSVPFSCQSDAILISYTSQTGGSGTSVSPYILTDCSFVSCACGHKLYLSGTSCVACPNNTLVKDDTSYYHTSGASACQYCSGNKLKLLPAPNVVLCIDCPGHATCDGGTTVICDMNYYGTSSCTKCPVPTDMFQDEALKIPASTTSNSGSTVITDCAVSQQNNLHDATGTFDLKSGCSYKK